MRLHLLVIPVFAVFAAWPISMVAGDTVIADSNIGQAIPGVENGQRAAMNWSLNCRGCHGADARGTSDDVPDMAGLMARFLSVDGGRDYLVRVPGVAFSSLGDDELAELVNWTLYRFDRDHVPPLFKPYDAAEVAELRGEPYVSEANIRRKELLGYMREGEAVAPSP